jgi:methylated-DNA-protein-cysteine methyltransferase-like protein
MYQPPDPASFNTLVWDIVRQIPAGIVSTYGQIASMLPPPDGVEPPQFDRLGARWVGSAMSAVPNGSDVPWQRVINSQGMISQRPGAQHQRDLLEAEGVLFDDHDRVDLARFGWEGPSESWLAERNLTPPRSFKRDDSSGSSDQMRLF